jgi:hypothetical protein
MSNLVGRGSQVLDQDRFLLLDRTEVAGLPVEVGRDCHVGSEPVSSEHGVTTAATRSHMTGKSGSANLDSATLSLAAAIGTVGYSPG